MGRKIGTEKGILQLGEFPKDGPLELTDFPQFGACSD